MKFRIFLFLIICTVVLPGCSKTKYLDEVEPYSALIGKNYELIVDCYVVEMFQTKDKSKYPIITCNTGIPGVGRPSLPRIVDRSNIGRVFGFLKIIGIVPKVNELTHQPIATVPNRCHFR